MEHQKLATGFQLAALIKQVDSKKIRIEEALGDTPCLVFRPESENVSPLFYSNEHHSSSSDVFTFSETGTLGKEETRAHGYLDPQAVVVPLWKSGRNALQNFIALGRSDRSDIRINSKQVSKTHAFISKNDSGLWQIVDNYSTNGTYVNEIKLEPAVPHYLNTHSEIKLGVIYAVFLDKSGLQQLCDTYEELGKGSTQKIRKKPSCSKCGDSHISDGCRGRVYETQEIKPYPG